MNRRELLGMAVMPFVALGAKGEIPAEDRFFLTLVPAGLLVFVDNRLFYGRVRWRGGDYRLSVGYYRTDEESGLRAWVNGHLVNMTRLWSLRPPRKSDGAVNIDLELGGAVKAPVTVVLDGAWRAKHGRD